MDDDLEPKAKLPKVAKVIEGNSVHGENCNNITGLQCQKVLYHVHFS